MRLIDADKLKEHKFLTPDAEEAKKWLPAETQGYQLGWNDAIDAIVDNAPPIETTIENLISTLSVEELKVTTRFKVDTPSGEAISFRKEKTGQWVADDYAGIHCNKCDYIPLKDVVETIYPDGTKKRSGNFNLTPYCPNCGIYMGKETSDE